MEKIYGYKEKDVLGLAQFILNRKGGTLTNAFNEYALQSGKAQGTVRNLYYALAKKSSADKEFRDKYLNGEILSVGKIVEFNESEERQLATSIIKEKIKGRSVRSIILELSGGDEAKALRYQNKYRNLLKNNAQLIETITKELLGNDKDKFIAGREISVCLQTKNLKSQINSLVDKIVLEIKKENQRLKSKITYLERENVKLRQELGETIPSDYTVRYFLKNDNRVVKA